MFALINNDGNRIISRHRTVRNAVRADSKLQRLVRKINGQNSYIATGYRRLVGDELEPLTDDEQDEVVDAIGELMTG